MSQVIGLGIGLFRILFLEPIRIKIDCVICTDIILAVNLERLVHACPLSALITKYLEVFMVGRRLNLVLVRQLVAHRHDPDRVSLVIVWSVLLVQTLGCL